MNYNGRFGDTQQRMVNGEPSHVNDIEAHWIDSMGPLGELATMATGSGTTNPYDGKKEYFWPQLATAIAPSLVQIGGSMLSNHLNEDETNLESNMNPWQETLNRRADAASDMMNPQSQFSMDGANRIREAGKDNLAFTNMLGQRNKALGGVQGYSGITEQQNAANLNKSNANILDRTQDFNRRNFSQGLNALQDIGKEQRQYGEMQTQQEIANMPFNFGDALMSFGSGYGGNMFDNLSNEQYDFNESNNQYFDEYGSGYSEEYS